MSWFPGAKIRDIRYRIPIWVIPLTQKLPPSGINQREQDVYDAFKQVSDRIIEIGPDLVVPADMVNHPRMDYIALGHYHRVIKVGEWAYYSGSTKQFGFVHHLEITCQIETPKGAMISSTDISVLPMEFEAFVNAWRVDRLEKKRLKEMGLKYLETFVPEEEGGNSG